MIGWPPGPSLDGAEAALKIAEVERRQDLPDKPGQVVRAKESVQRASPSNDCRPLRHEEAAQPDVPLSTRGPWSTTWRASARRSCRRWNGQQALLEQRAIDRRDLLEHPPQSLVVPHVPLSDRIPLSRHGDLVRAADAEADAQVEHGAVAARAGAPAARLSAPDVPTPQRPAQDLCQWGRRGRGAGAPVQKPDGSWRTTIHIFHIYI